MKILKRSNLMFLALVSFISSCKSVQVFTMTTLKEDLHTIELDRNRIIHECYFMNAEKENNWRHQYVLYMLNDKNEVIPVFYPTNQGIDECMAHLKKVEKIIKNQNRVKLCVHDKLEQMDFEDSKRQIHDFGILGKYKSPYYSLTFDTICNSKKCYSLSDMWLDTCPDFK